MRNVFFGFALLLYSGSLHSQISRASHWFFGYKAGISFNTGTVVANTQSQMQTIEGSATISDLSGSLLFYSDGLSVWNKNHVVMPNGTGLQGDQSSAQSSIIVPLPGSATKYYLFCTNNNFNGATYSVIDMSLQNGSGDVTSTKNVPLFSPSTEELAATRHCDGTDFWIVFRAYQQGSLIFHSYLLTASGLSQPVTTTINVSNPNYNAVGHLTFSQQGNVLAFTSVMVDPCILSFNQQTGSLSLITTFPRRPNEQIYSNALSPSGNKLYITSWTAGGKNYLSQFNLQSSNIAASRVDLDSVDFYNGSPNGYGFIGELRLAPDYRIYISRWHQKNPYVVNPGTYYSLDSLDGIKFPELAGTSCGHQRNLVYLNHQPTMLGLPNFVSQFTDSVIDPATCVLITGLDKAYSRILNVYPNPSNGNLTVKFTGGDSHSKICLIDKLGLMIREYQLPPGDETLHLSLEVPVGLYVLQLWEAGQLMASKKIIVKEDE